MGVSNTEERPMAVTQRRPRTRVHNLVMFIPRYISAAEASCRKRAVYSRPPPPPCGLIMMKQWAHACHRGCNKPTSICAHLSLSLSAELAAASNKLCRAGSQRAISVLRRSLKYLPGIAGEELARRATQRETRPPNNV